MSEILAVGAGCIGATIGLVTGMLVSRHIGLTPHAKELSKALEENESYYRTMMARLKGRLREYEQPSELQKIASSGMAEGDMMGMILAELPNMKLPKWVRPFIPAIQGYIKENPEQVKALIEKFSNQIGKGKGIEEAVDTL